MRLRLALSKIYIPLKLNRIIKGLTPPAPHYIIYIPLKLNRIGECKVQRNCRTRIYIPLKLNRIKHDGLQSNLLSGIYIPLKLNRILTPIRLAGNAWRHSATDVSKLEEHLHSS